MFIATHDEAPIYVNVASINTLKVITFNTPVEWQLQGNGSYNFGNFATADDAAAALAALVDQLGVLPTSPSTA